MMSIYLDNAATTPLDTAAMTAMQEALALFGNPSSVHAEGRRAKRLIEQARRKVATCIGAQPNEVYFTSGGTEADNWALWNGTCGGKRPLAVSAVEHHAVLHRAEALKAMGCSLRVLPVDQNGVVRLETLKKALAEGVACVSVMAANNETGVLQPVEEIGRLCREAGALFHTDAVQAVGSVPVDVNAWRADMLSLSAHKFHGPKGVGVLYVRNGIPLHPLHEGGAQERGQRGGTENTVAIAGMGAAIGCACEPSALRQHSEKIRVLRDRFVGGVMAALPGVTENSVSADRLPGIASLTFEGVSGPALLINLDLKGVYASGGSACTAGSVEPSHVLEAMGVERRLAQSTLRFSLSRFNTEEEIDCAVAAVAETVTHMRRDLPVNL